VRTLTPAAQISVPPPPEKLRFPDPHRIRSRDIFRLYARVWPFIRPYRRHVVFLMLTIVPALPAGLVALVMARIFFDVIGNGHPLTRGEALLIHAPLNASRETVLLHFIVISVIVAAIALPIAGLIFGYAVWILQRITNLFRVDLYTRLQELSLRFHGEEKIGDAIFRMFQDSAAIPQVIDTLIMRPIMSIPFVIADLVWLALLNRQMAIVLAVCIPAEFALAILYSDSLRHAFVGEREATAQATTRIEETLASIKTVKAFGTEQPEGETYARDNWNAFMAARRARMMLVRYRVANNTLYGLARLSSLYLGARQVLTGGGILRAAVSLGTFQGTLSILSRSSMRVAQLTSNWGGLQDTTVAMARVLEMLGSFGENDVHSGSAIPPPAIDVLRFENVSFAYDTAEPVLRDVTLTARAGSITALAGASGSGKSTIVALMLRFFDPTAGRISAGGVDIRDFQLAAWRGIISVALQENPLFSASIRDNIAYSRSDASPEQIATAVLRAGLEPFISSLPEGLDTMLGEKGSKLSTGQAQRIGLARALLRDAQILLLDEPTASLDGATEEAVLAGIREWIDEAPTKRLVIIATHRQTTAALADQVFRMSAGRISAAEPKVLEAPASEVPNA
jgi:ATP-binding cassette, subfamily B, bacterial